MHIQLTTGEILVVQDRNLFLSGLLSDVMFASSPLSLLKEWLLSHRPPHRPKDEYRVKVDAIMSELVGMEEDLRDANNAVYDAMDPDIATLIRGNISDIFSDTVHSFRMVDDPTLRRVVEFLSLEPLGRSNVMFDNLPLLLQQREGAVADHVSPELQVYCRFMSPLDDDGLLALSRAACILQIHALTVLTACYISRRFAELTEAEVRTRFAIPSKFTDATLEEIRGVL